MAEPLRPEAMADRIRPHVRPLTLREACVDVGHDVIATDTAITGVSLDSRSAIPGDLYLALPGRNTHGARYANDAVAAGAAAIVTDTEGALLCNGVDVPIVVVDDPRAASGTISGAVYGWPARDLQMIGVTGTNGKSTVTAMIEAGLRAAGRSAGTIGTLGVHLGDEALPGVRTTPEAPDLQALLAVMRDRGVQSVVMEVSSIALAEHRVDSIRYDVAGFTQLTQDHLDYHGDMESYFAAKSLLFTPEHAALGIVGVDDDYGRRLAAEAGVPVATWSIQDMTADWHVEAARTTGLGSVVTVTAPDGERSMLHVPVPGAFNVANALCAFAMLRAAGINPDDAALGIGAVSVPGRMQVVGHRVLDEGTSPIVGIVDYAHTPDAVIRVLEALASQRRVIAVLGAGGDRDSAKRPLMGAAAARLADVVIVTDDNPRSEDPRAIRSAILQGARPVAVGRGSTVLEEGDRARAISMAVAHAAAGDAVVVLGKGHETGQEVAGVTTDFDDAVVLLTALKTGTAP